MIIKEPNIIDISFWESDIFWDKLSPMPTAIIAKASEYKWNDPKFQDHWMNMTKLSGVSRGAYHFFRYNDVVPQAETYLNQMRKAGALTGRTWLAEFPPILDVELAPNWRDKKAVSGTKLAGQVKTWLDYVESATGVRPMIYTSQYYWSFLSDFFGRPPSWTGEYLLWLAWYPQIPDNYPTPPTNVLPKGFKGWDMWQYNDAARFAGIPYDGVDVNIATENLMKIIKRSDYVPPVEEPSTDSTVVFTNGITFKQLRRFDSNVFVLVIDQNKRNGYIPRWGMKTTEEVAGQTGAFAVINGGDHNPTTGRPVGLFGYGKGSLFFYPEKTSIKRNRDDYEPFVCLQKDKLSIRAYDEPVGMYGFALKRFLIYDGKLWPKHDTPAWSKIDFQPRTLYGIRADGQFVVTVVDGRQANSRGITLEQAANIMLEQGCVRAGDGDGGKSSVMWLNGKIVNNPCEGEIKVGTHLAIV